MKVAITGSSGLVGTALAASLRADGHDVIRLVRRPPRAAGELRWDPRAADAGLLPSGTPGPSALDRLGADAGIRVVHIRSGLVLTPRGGMLARLLPLARLGLCPRFSSGRQVMSWISLSDEIGAIRFLLGREDLSGPVNLTAPAPVTNAEFTAALTAAVGRRDLSRLRVPALALRLAVGEAAVELLTSARVRSRRLQEAGYQFRHPALPGALAAELASR